MEWPPDAPPLAAVWDAVATWMAALPDTEGVSTNRAVAEAFGDAYEVTRLLPLRRHIKAILQQQLAHGQMADLEFYRAPPRGGGTPGSPPTGRTLTKGGRGSGGAKKPAAAAAVTIPAAAPLPAHDGDTSEDDDAARLARGRRRVVVQSPAHSARSPSPASSTDGAAPTAAAASSAQTPVSGAKRKRLAARERRNAAAAAAAAAAAGGCSDGSGGDATSGSEAEGFTRRRRGGGRLARAPAARSKAAAAAASGGGGSASKASPGSSGKRSPGSATKRVPAPVSYAFSQDMYVEVTDESDYDETRHGVAELASIVDARAKAMVDAVTTKGATHSVAGEYDDDDHATAVMLYHAVLHVADSARDTPKFYQLQVLERDAARALAVRGYIGDALSQSQSRGAAAAGTGAYWVAAKWGRVGATTPANSLMPAASRDEAIATFKRMFAECTGGISFNEAVYDVNAAVRRRVPGSYWPHSVSFKAAATQPAFEAGAGAGSDTSSSESSSSASSAPAAARRRRTAAARKQAPVRRRLPLRRTRDDASSGSGSGSGSGSSASSSSASSSSGSGSDAESGRRNVRTTALRRKVAASSGSSSGSGSSSASEAPARRMRGGAGTLRRRAQEAAADAAAGTAAPAAPAAPAVTLASMAAAAVAAAVRPTPPPPDESGATQAVEADDESVLDAHTVSLLTSLFRPAAADDGARGDGALPAAAACVPASGAAVARAGVLLSDIAQLLARGGGGGGAAALTSRLVGLSADLFRVLAGVPPPRRADDDRRVPDRAFVTDACALVRQWVAASSAIEALAAAAAALPPTLSLPEWVWLRLRYDVRPTGASTAPSVVADLDAVLAGTKAGMRTPPGTVVFELRDRAPPAALLPAGTLPSRMLWYAAPPAVVLDVLTHGFRLPPPGLPATGFPLGRAVHLYATAAGALAACSGAAPLQLLLVEVATGVEHATPTVRPFTALPGGCHCVRGTGRLRAAGGAGGEVAWLHPAAGPDGGDAPPPRIVQCLSPADAAADTDFDVDTFAVYDTAQLQPRYLLPVTLPAAAAEAADAT